MLAFAGTSGVGSGIAQNVKDLPHFFKLSNKIPKLLHHLAHLVINTFSKLRKLKDK